MRKINYSRVAESLQVPFVVLSIYWCLFYPPPGYAVAALAFAAAIMAVRTEHFTRTEQVVWILLAGALCFIEFRAISKDRDEHDQMEASIRWQDEFNRKQDRRQFTKLLEQGSALFAQEKQLSAQTLKNEKLAGEGVAETTGGNSFPYVWMGVFQNSLLAQPSVCGTHPLQQVHITIVDEDAADVAFKAPGGTSLASLNAARRNVPLIDFLSIASLFNPVATYPIEANMEHRAFNVSFIARNGGFQELIRVKRTQEDAGRVFRTAVVVAASYFSKNKGVVLEKIDRNFPQETLSNDKESNDFKKLPRLDTGCRAP